MMQNGKTLQNKKAPTILTKSNQPTRISFLNILLKKKILRNIYPLLYMAIRVIDLNEEVKEKTPTLEQVGDFLNSNSVGVKPIEEDTKELVVDIVNEIIEEPKEETPIEEEKPKPRPKAKPKASDIVSCDKCHKSMTYKNLRYSHKYSPEPPPVKKQAKPKAKQTPKAKPKPPPEIYYSDDEEEVPTQPLIEKKQPTHEVLSEQRNQPINPTTALAQHYQLLQQQLRQQKQEKYNNLCQSIFSSKSKKR